MSNRFSSQGSSYALLCQNKVEFSFQLYAKDFCVLPMAPDSISVLDLQGLSARTSRVQLLDGEFACARFTPGTAVSPNKHQKHAGHPLVQLLTSEFPHRDSKRERERVGSGDLSDMF